jgi:DNA (cytosine-5)-methyltransferase 1
MIVIDLFAGGGGASEGIKRAIGRDPDIAINHDKVAIAVHEANHPGTRHYQEDIWHVPPRRAIGTDSVGLLWSSPDCTHFSKAKGNKPKRDLKRRSLAWAVKKWIREVRPRVVILENVEEFTTWGPLDSAGKIIISQKGTTYSAFVRRIKRLGYKVEARELRASDYGAPTIRKRLFLIARCDGLPIVWPEPTHGPGLIPYRTAAEIIDWSIPCPSIFERKRPLVENTMRRIAKGIQRYVIEAESPFILNLTHGGRLEPINEPLRTITAAHRGEKAIVTPYIIPIQHYNGSDIVQPINEPLRTITAYPKGGAFAIAVPHIQRQFGQGVGSAIDEPIGTTTAGGLGKSALVMAFMAQHNGGFYTGGGRPVDKPISTITYRGTQQQIVTSHLLKLRGTCKDGQPVNQPMPTVTAGGNHIGEVRAFMTKFYTNEIGQKLTEPAPTVTSKNHLGLVTVMIQGEPYVITDIGMRMLSPRELFRAQGFDDDYKIDIEIDGRRTTKTDQVRLCGNSVCPPIASALVEANTSFLTRRLAEVS